MMKLLIFGLLAWVLVSMLRKKLQNHSPKSQASHHSAKPAEQVVPCKHCGIHIPRSSALFHKQQLFCSQQHIDAHEMAQR